MNYRFKCKIIKLLEATIKENARELGLDKDSQTWHKKA